jgi:hypothetical protein
LIHSIGEWIGASFILLQRSGPTPVKVTGGWNLAVWMLSDRKHVLQWFGLGRRQVHD